jgi:hypothetical protein
MRDAEQAAHLLGKLLKYVGEDSVPWGTDSIFYGSHTVRATGARSSACVRTIAAGRGGGGRLSVPRIRGA